MLKPLSSNLIFENKSDKDDEIHVINMQMFAASRCQPAAAGTASLQPTLLYNYMQPGVIALYLMLLLLQRNLNLI